MHQRRLRSAKSQRDQELTKFIETFNRFETAFAKCQQPDVRSKHKLLLFERQFTGTIRSHSRSYLSEVDAFQNSPPRMSTPTSVRAQSAKGRSAGNILLRGSIVTTPVHSTRGFCSTTKDSHKEAWHLACTSMLSALYRAKCVDLKVDCNAKQQKIFISRLEAKLNQRKFVCPENGFGLESAKVIEKFVRSHSSLIILVLDRNCFGDEAVKVIAQAVPGSNLIKLSMVSTNMSWGGAAEIFNSLYQTDKLTQLNLSSCEGLYRNKIGYEGIKGLQNVLKSVQTLHCLDVSGSGITMEGWRAVCQGLSGNRSLCSLSIGKNDLRSDGFALLMPRLSQCNLQKFDVSRNHIQDPGLIALADVIGGSQNRRCLASTLRILDLSDNNITSIGFEYFCRQLVKNFTIERLCLDRNPLSKGNRFQIFRLLLQSTKSLTYLSIRNVFLEQEDFLYLSEGMEYNTSLIEFDMSENYLERTAFLQVCQFLKVNRILKVLHLTKCNISDDGVSQLAQAVDKTRTLEKLYLQHNFIKDSGARQLEQLLVRNSQLTGLHIEKNMVSLQRQRDIRRSLDENTLVAALGEPNMLVYQLKQEDNVRRRTTLLETIAALQRKYEQTYRHNLQQEVLYYDCAIDEARRHLQHEKQKLAVMQTIGNFYTTS